MTTDPFTEADVERAAKALFDSCPDCEGSLMVLDVEESYRTGEQTPRRCDRCGYLNAGLTPSAERVARAVLATVSLDQIRAQAKAEGIREATDRVQRHVYDLQCPTSARGYVKGARMAHRWWEKVLGGELGRLRELADEIEEAKTDG